MAHSPRVDQNAALMMYLRESGDGGTHGDAGAVAATVLGVDCEALSVGGVARGSVEGIDNGEALGCKFKFVSVHVPKVTIQARYASCRKFWHESSSCRSAC
jgi:hypothetical protein